MVNGKLPTIWRAGAMQKKMRKLKLAGKHQERQAIKDARKLPKTVPKKPSLKTLSRSDIEENISLFARFAERDGEHIDKEETKQKNILYGIIVCFLVMAIAGTSAIAKGINGINLGFILFSVFITLTSLWRFRTSFESGDNLKKEQKKHLEFAEGWRLRLREFDSGMQITMKINWTKTNNHGRRIMTETKCITCGVEHTTGTNHACKDEDVEKQKATVKKYGHWLDKVR